MRQLRIAQGKDMDRIERVWLLTDQAVPDAGCRANSRVRVLSTQPERTPRRVSRGAASERSHLPY